MTAHIIDGKALAQHTRQDVARRAAALTARGVTPGLAVILVGLMTLVTLVHQWLLKRTYHVAR